MISSFCMFSPIFNMQNIFFVNPIMICPAWIENDTEKKWRTLSETIRQATWGHRTLDRLDDDGFLTVWRHVLGRLAKRRRRLVLVPLVRWYSGCRSSVVVLAVESKTSRETLWLKEWDRQSIPWLDICSIRKRDCSAGSALYPHQILSSHFCPALGRSG